MKKSVFSSNTLACFSPPVMIATFIIEICLMAYVIWRYKLTSVTRLIAAILTALAVFQLAEYNVCEAAFGLSSLDWSRLGYMSITALPPLGIHLALTMAGKKAPWLTWGAYTVGAAFATYFLVASNGLTSSVCQGNYVIFKVAHQAMLWYAMYYWGLLTVGVMLCLRLARTEKNKLKARSFRALATGYLAFMVPTTLVIMIDPSTRAAIPSIMCGFAVFLAVILVAEVLPNHQAKRSLWAELAERVRA